MADALFVRPLPSSQFTPVAIERKPDTKLEDKEHGDPLQRILLKLTKFSRDSQGE